MRFIRSMTSSWTLAFMLTTPGCTHSGSVEVPSAIDESQTPTTAVESQVVQTSDEINDAEEMRQLYEDVAQVIENDKAGYDSQGRRLTSPRNTIASTPESEIEELESLLQEFIDRPLDELQWELKLTTSDEPEMPRDGRGEDRWYWFSRKYHDKYFEIHYEWQGVIRYVRDITLQDASNRTSANSPD